MAVVSLLLAGLAGAAPVLARTRTERVAHSVIPASGGAVSTGRLSPSKVVQVSLRLTRPDAAGEALAYKAMYDPASPSFHHFLTPAQYAARFGVGAARADATRAFLTNGKLHVTFASSNGATWLATGRVADVERLFKTSMDTYREGSLRFYGNAVAPQVPSSLGVASVGLTDRFKLRTHAFPVSATTTPADLWSIYGQPADNTGQGEQLALFGWGASDGVESDLRKFESVNGLPQMPFRIRHVGAAPDPTDTGGRTEWAIDSQASTGMAPGALLETFYFATSGIVDEGIAALQAWIDDPNGAHQGSASYGLCESNPAYAQLGADYSSAMDETLRQAALQGRTLFASSGDTGSGCPVPAVPVNVNGVEISPLPMQEMPAASPYAVAVGGTVITTDDGSPPKRDVEYTWTHGGGGSTAFEAEPAYQAGVAAVNRLCISSSSGDTSITGQTCRGVPDVAAQSGDLLSGYEIYVDGAQSFGGGTSLSSPLWLSMWARVQAAAPTTDGLGFANESFYPIGLDATRYANDFTDVTIGANGLYVATPGWDYTTGWGVPNVRGLMVDLAGGTTPTHPGAALPPDGGGGGGSSGDGIDACQPLWVDDAGDEAGSAGAPVNGQPAQDLLEGAMATPGDGNLHVSVTVSDLSTDLPPGSTFADYFTFWTAKGTTYYADATVDMSGAVTYADGVAATDSTGATNFTKVHDVTGSFSPGPNGTVEVVVPLTNVGDPATGTRLQNVHTSAYLASDPGDFLQNTADDAGPGQPFAIGQSCTGGVSSVPADPDAVPPPPPPPPGGGACTGASQITDPSGDSFIDLGVGQVTNNDDTDIVSGAFTWDASAHALKLSATVAALRGDTDVPPLGSDGEVFDIGFTVAGKGYYGRLSRNLVDGASFVLRQEGSGTAGTSDTTLGDMIEGSFDPATNTVSASIPATLLADLQTGAVLTALHVDAGQDEQAVLLFNDHATADCTYTLP